MFLHKNKDKTYSIRYKKLDGKYTQKRLKTNSKVTAYKELQKFIQDRKHGVIQIDTVVIDTLLNNYVTPKTQYIVNRFYKMFSPTTPVTQFKPIQFEQYRDDRFKDGISPISVNDELTFFKGIFNKSIRMGLISSNPVIGVKYLPKPVNNKRQTFTDDEIKLLIDSIDYQNFKQLVMFSFYTGCRIGEIVNLQWSDIKNGVITIAVRTNENNEYIFLPKNRDTRYIPISKELQKLIDDIPFNSETVFVDKNGVKFNVGHVSKLFKKYIRKLNLPDNLHFHSIRHTILTNLLKNGHSVYDVKTFIGHKSYVTTLAYAHPVSDDIKNISDSISLK